jgi:hypothetical protein
MNTNMSTLTYPKWLSIITPFHVSEIRFQFQAHNLLKVLYTSDSEQVPLSTWSESSVKATSFYPMFATAFLLNQRVHFSALATRADSVL